MCVSESAFLSKLTEKAGSIMALKTPLSTLGF